MSDDPNTGRTGRPVDQETIRAIRRMATEEHKGRNQIARELGIGYATVSRYAHEAGIEFDRTQSELAVRARGLDLAAERQSLAAEMMVLAREALAQIDAPVIVRQTHYQPTISDDKGSVMESGGWVDHDLILDRPTIVDQRNLITTAAIAFDKATRLLEKDGSGVEKSLGVLDAFDEVVQAGRAVLRAREETTLTDNPA